MECVNCKACNPEGQKYCGSCGTLLDSELGILKEFLDANLPKQIQAVLEERLRDQKVVDVETTQAIVTRLSNWGKLFGFFVGIPVTLLFLVVGFLGLRTYSDFSKFIKDTKNDIESKVGDEQIREVTLKLQKAEQLVDEIGNEGSGIKAEYAKHKEELAEINKIAKELNGLRKEVEQIGNKVDILFEPSAELSQENQQSYRSSLSAFGKYLQRLGFPFEGQISIKVGSDVMKDQVYYYAHENSIFVGKNRIGETQPVLSIYAQIVLRNSTKDSLSWSMFAKPKFYAILIGASEYFTCSFTSDPPMKSTRKFSEVVSGSFYPYDAGRIWAIVFWETRELFGKDAMDKLLCSTWTNLQVSDSHGDIVRNFTDRLLKMAESSKISGLTIQIQSILDHRELFSREKVKDTKKLEGKLVRREVIADEMIPDNDTKALKSPITIDNSGEIESIEVNVDITHTWSGDISVSLIAPWGEEFILHNRSGGHADNLIARYSDESVSALKRVIGKKGNGTWTLAIRDHTLQDVGKLNKWSLELIFI